MYTNSPMGFALLIVFMFVAFGLTTLFRRWIDIPTLLAVAIGCAVNANIFTPLNSGVVVGPFIFSIEAILYTLFMYTIVIRILDYGYKAAQRMALTSIAAIIISAVIEFIAMLSYEGFAVGTLKQFSFYFLSSVGTILGVWVMILITIFCRKKNVSSYIIIPLAIIASGLIHSIIFYGGMALINWSIDENAIAMILGAIVGKGVCIGLSVFCYFINQKWWKPLSLMPKEKEYDRVIKK